ncbi:MAG TPA: FAD-dependent oxidoreductase [Modicisalibacter sp.]|nr:FAD-dependent oxidoreductase [Modicisalibacter sp.]
MSDAPHIVLVGAGHAHLHVAAHAGQLLQAGAAVTLISPGDFWYSGMASGMLGGDYTESDDRLDPAALIESAGGSFLPGYVTAIDRKRRLLHLAEGPPVAYDLVSLNLGSRVDMSIIRGLSNSAASWPAKPVSNLWCLREALESALASAATLPRLAVVGGGPTGVELAANLLGLGERYGRQFEITLISASPRLLPDAPRGASAWVTRRLHRRGLRLELGANALAYAEGQLTLDDASVIACDRVLVATGLIAPGLVSELGLEHDPYQGLAIAPTLHAIDDERLFAVGDCAWLPDSPYPKLGVFGVRQAPILLHNLIASLHGEPLEAYQPQQRYLSILNLGDSRGLALWGPLWWPGRLALKAKRRLDHRFMDRHRGTPS